MRGWRKIGLWIALALVAGAATAASVVKGGATETTVCDTYGSVTVDTVGKVTLVGCTVNTPSTTWSGATFTLATETANTTTATSGTSLNFKVTRSGGTYPATGGVPLTLTLVSSPSTLVTTPPTFTFGASDTAITHPVTFTTTAATTATLSLSGAGANNTAATSPNSLTISVSPAAAGSCAGFTAPYTVVDLGTLSLKSNTLDPAAFTRSLPASSSAPTQGAFKFTVPSQALIDTDNPSNIIRYFVTMETNTVAAAHTRSFGVSQCVGEYHPIATGCYVVGTPTIAWGSNLPTYECQVIPGKSYYYNIMALNNDETPLRNVADGFVLKVVGSP